MRYTLLTQCFKSKFSNLLCVIHFCIRCMNAYMVFTDIFFKGKTNIETIIQINDCCGFCTLPCPVNKPTTNQL